MELTTAEKIVKAKITLQSTHPFYAYILMSMRIKECSEKDIPTMGVNAIGDLYYSAKFAESLTREELYGVLCHETLHISTDTFGRKGSRDHQLWNIATDYAINWIIMQEGRSSNSGIQLRLPKGVLMPDNNGVVTITAKNSKKVSFDITNMCAEEIYDKLLNHAELVKVALGCKADGSYDGQIDKHIEGDGDEKGDSQGKLNSDADVRENASYWKDKAVEAATVAKQRGKFSAALEREMGNLLEPKIDWRKKLIHFITKDLPVDFTMRRPGRRTHALGVYMPHVIRENLEVLIGIDVSGSISQNEYDEFMSEIVGMARGFQQLKMRVIFWSTYVDERDDIVVEGGGIDKLLTHKVNNSGGTTMGCFAAYVEEKGYPNPSAVVMFTDGFIESDPKMLRCKHLFVLPKNHSDEIVKNLGEVCSLNDIERNG